MVFPYLFYALASGPLTRSRVIKPVVSAISAQPLQLANWLEQNDAILKSSIGIDNGLRGLVARNGEGDSLCRIPRNCVIVADRSSAKRNTRPIDALANSLLQHIRRAEDESACSRVGPYIASLPGPNDLSLTGIGATWTDDQLDLLGHDFTKKQWIKLRMKRDSFIQRNGVAHDENDELLAGWAYDLASSRALQGPFGRGGAVRAALAGTLISVLMAFLPAFYLNDLSRMPFESAVPVILSVVLVSSLVVAEPELAMIPWIDLANHKSKSHLNLEYDLLHDSIALKGQRKSIPGESFVNFDYGGRQGIDNNKLLGEYGFVEENNPSDILHIEVGEDIVTIGRHGVVRSSTRSNESFVKEKEVTNAVLKARARLLAVGTATATEDGHITIDFDRTKLAALWRREKIRLLDEYLER
mmetsp:Transcript_25161/g.55818  ORF Transcript_25161/g.55818 Transcript_25161/m.55818 type:complete len:414 (+) Transcript_25161:83-1324(+)